MAHLLCGTRVFFFKLNRKVLLLILLVGFVSINFVWRESWTFEVRF